MRKWIYVNEEGGNTAMIEEVMVYPYKGAKKKQKAFKVTAMSTYEQNFIYHVSVFDDLSAAEDDLASLCFDAEMEIKRGVGCEY